jgi:hypothetical protein
VVQDGFVKVREHIDGLFSKAAFRGFRTPALAAVVALLVLAADPPAPITIDYPENGSIFPPEITAPTFVWRDGSASAAFWRIEVNFGDGSAPIRAVSRGERLRIGEIDPRCVSDNNELPKLTPPSRPPPGLGSRTPPLGPRSRGIL